MANSDLCVRLTGDNSNLQNALAQTRRALQETGQTSSKLEDIQKRFDKISQSSAPLGKKISDIRKAMEQMAASGQNTTEEGKKMWEQMANAAREYDAMLRQIRQDTSSVPDLDKGKKGGGLGGIDLKGIGGGIADQAGLGGITQSLGGLAAMANPATIAVAAVGGTMIAAGKAAGDFEVHLDDLQALTKVTDAEISAMGDTAIGLSKKFGIGAGDIVDSMGVIGSQAPELLKDAEALSFVTDAAMTLGKAGSISAEAAASAITTVMNQMGVAGSEALNVANTLEAAEQQGSASVEYLNTAIEKSGTIAKQAGMSYVDLAAMVETVAPKFSSADVAGTGLNSTLLALTQAEDQFNPAIVGVTTALQNLNEAHLSNAELSKMVGSANLVMVNAMMEGVDTFTDFQSSIDGTNAAVESWQTKSNNMAGAIDKLTATWDAFLIKLGQSGLIQGIADNIMIVMEALGEVLDVITEVISAFEGFGGEGTEQINLLQIQLDALVTIISAVGEVLSVVIRIFSKIFEEMREIAGDVSDWIGQKWDNLKSSLGDVAFARFIINAFESIMRKATEIIAKVKNAWNDLKKFLGMEVEADVKANPGMTPQQRKAGENQQRQQIAEDTRKRNEEAAARASSGGKKKGGKTGSGGGSKTKTEKVDYLVSVDDGSLDTAEKKLSAFQGKKKSLPITATAEIAAADAEIKKWTEEVEKRKLALGPKIDEGSVTDIQNQIKKIEGEKTLLLNTKADPADIKAIDDQIKALKKQLEEEQIRVGVKPFVDPNSLNGIKAQIKQKQDELALLLNSDLDPAAIQRVSDELDALRKREREKSIELGLTTAPTITAPEEKMTKGSTADKRQSLSNANSIADQVKSDYKVGLIGKEEAMAQLDELDKKLAELGLKPLELHVNDDGSITSAFDELEKYKEQMNSTADIVSNMGSVFGSLGSAIGGSAGEMLNFAGQTLNTIAQVIPQIVTLITAKQAEAMASGTASASALPFPANIAAIASIVATVASLFASLPKFETGGIVGGNSYHGDKLLARVNSGEMILNQKQQRNLYNTLGAVGAQGAGGGVSGDVRFHIAGTALKGTLRNHEKKMSKIK